MRLVATVNLQASLLSGHCATHPLQHIKIQPGEQMTNRQQGLGPGNKNA